MMSNELKNKIKNELHRALVYFGEDDEEILNEKVENDVDTLMCFMAGSSPEQINTETGVIEGYQVNVVVNSDENGSHVIAVDMVVTKTDLLYVFHSYETDRSDDWHYGYEFKCKNETKKIVRLEDVDANLFNCGFVEL